MLPPPNGHFYFNLTFVILIVLSLVHKNIITVNFNDSVNVVF